MSATDELNAAPGSYNRVSERLRGIAADMRGIGASSMTPRELFAYWAHEVDKAADLADFLGGGECELAYGENDDGVDGWYTHCGGWFAATRKDRRLVHPGFCQLCGGKAVER